MAHEYGRRHGTIGPCMRNLWDRLPDFNLGGLSPSYSQFAPQTEEEYEAQRNRPNWPITSADPMQDVTGRIQAGGGWPGRAPWQTPSRRLTEGGPGMGEKAGPDIPESWEPSIGYDVSKPVEEEDDEMQKLLRYMFLSELMAGMAGGDPPPPYTVQAGPAARAFPTMPTM